MKENKEIKIIEFYGKECPHCLRMAPIVEKLEKELGIEIKKYEVWHSEANAKMMEEKYGVAVSEACGGGLGVPNFVNENTNEGLCGEVSYDILKKWILG
ncbi:MAG: hypothetical protein HYV52_00335 [Parcubacteria group bacterium]|nr:hypothetical protein [Parcubacteria group bacterium]